MIKNHHCRKSLNEITYNGILFFLDTFKENFSKSAAYHAVKKYQGIAKSVHLSKQNGQWMFDREIF